MSRRAIKEALSGPPGDQLPPPACLFSARAMLEYHNALSSKQCTARLTAPTATGCSRMKQATGLSASNVIADLKRRHIATEGDSLYQPWRFFGCLPSFLPRAMTSAAIDAATDGFQGSHRRWR